MWVTSHPLACRCLYRFAQARVADPTGIFCPVFDAHPDRYIAADCYTRVLALVARKTAKPKAKAKTQMDFGERFTALR
jgi:hypothetical protein